MTIHGFEAVLQAREAVFERIVRCYQAQYDGDGKAFANEHEQDPMRVCEQDYAVRFKMHYGTDAEEASTPDPRPFVVALEQPRDAFTSAVVRMEVPATGIIDSEPGSEISAHVEFPTSVVVRYPLRRDGKRIVVRPSLLPHDGIEVSGAPEYRDFIPIISHCLNRQAAAGSDGQLIDRLSGLIALPDAEPGQPQNIAYEVVLFDEVHPLRVLDIEFDGPWRGELVVAFDAGLSLQFLPPGLFDEVEHRLQVHVRIPFSVAPLDEQTRVWTLFPHRLSSTSFNLPAQDFSDELYDVAQYIFADLLGLELGSDIDPGTLGALLKLLRSGFFGQIQLSHLAPATVQVPALTPERFVERLWDAFRDHEDIVLLSFEDSEFARSISPRVYERGGLSIGVNGTESPAGSLPFIVPLGRDFRFAIAGEVVQPDLDAAAVSARTDFNADTDDASLRSLSIGLGEQAFNITGGGEIFIDCWPDPDFDLEGRLLVTGVDFDGGLQVDRDGDFDIDIHQDCGVTALYAVVGVLTGGIGAAVLGILQATVFSTDGEQPADDNFDELANVGQRALVDDDSAVELGLLFEDVTVTPSRIVFAGRVTTPCDGAIFGRRRISGVMWDRNRAIVGVRLADVGWELTAAELIRLMDNGQIEISNADVVRGPTRKYLRSPANDSPDDNLDALPKFRM